MFKTITEILGLRNKVNAPREKDIVAYARSVLAGTGLYASKSMSDDWPKWAQKMEADLLTFEQNAKTLSSSALFMLAGKGWELFSIWYRRKGEDKTTPLRRAIAMFDEALKTDPDNEETKIALAGILIERKQVRDLNRALNLLEQVKNRSSYANELMSKAKRWLGQVEFKSEFDYTEIQLLPLGALREERKKCRSLIRSMKKEKKIGEMKEVLEHMYRLAVLHDAATYVLIHCHYFVDSKKDRAWDKKLNNIARTVHKYSYSKNGILPVKDRAFLSLNDYKTFELIFGATDKEFDPVSLLK